MDVDWVKIASVVGAAAGLGLLLHFLLRDDPSLEDTEAGGTQNAQTDDEDSEKTRVIGILQDLAQSQLEVKNRLRVLSKEAANSDLSYLDIYKRVVDTNPEDPLQRRGLTLMDLEAQLRKHSDDPFVKVALDMVLNGSVGAARGDPETELGKAELIEINVFKLQELFKFFAFFDDRSDKASFDPKILGFVLQIVLDSKVIQKFHATSDDQEYAFGQYQEALLNDEKFVQTQRQLSQAMVQLYG